MPVPILHRSTARCHPRKRALLPHAFIRVLALFRACFSSTALAADHALCFNAAISFARNPALSEKRNSTQSRWGLRVVRVVREIRMLRAMWRELETGPWDELRHRHRAKAVGNSNSSSLQPPRQFSTLLTRGACGNVSYGEG